MDFKKIIKLLPLTMALLIIPISMKLKIIDIPFDVQLHWKGTATDFDIFSYFKSTLLIINAFTIIGILFFTFNNETWIKMKRLKPFMIAIGILFLTSIVSTLLGGNSVISLGGAPSRYEGLYTYIGYYILFFYASTMKYDKNLEHMIIIIIAIFTILCAIVGYTQYFGNDIFRTPFGTKLYIPESLKQYRDSMTSTSFDFKTMYIFTTHYNYASMMMSVMSMFWFVYFICSKELVYKIIASVMALLSFLMLLGTNARSGIVAIFIAFVLLFIIFFKNIFSNKKVLLSIVLIMVVFIGVATKLGLMSRFSSLVNDIKKIGDAKEYSEDYIKTQIPLKDIKTTDNTYKVVYENFVLVFNNKENKFYNENNKPLEFTIPVKGTLNFKDAKYSNVSISTSSRASNENDGGNRLYHSVKIDNFNFNFDVTDRVKLVNHVGLEIMPEKAKRIGFKGMEKLGSGRGYITSATLPLILKSPIIGYGADSFLQVFNQDDIYTKMYVYENPHELVDKPHNLYLLYAVNFGLIGLIVFLFIVVYLVIKAKNRYKEKDISADAFFISAMAGVLSYMGSGFFNDSVLSVSTVFWALLGIAVSGICQDEKVLF